MLLGRFQASSRRRKKESLIVAQRQGTQKEKENILLPGETSFKDKELRQASELQLRDRGTKTKGIAGKGTHQYDSGLPTSPPRVANFSSP